MLEILDIFGTTFEFTIYKKSKYKTSIGGLLTILVLITISVFIYLFGRDFFLKLNPKINTEEIILNEYGNPINITNDNLIIAFRIEDDTQSYVPFEGDIFPTFDFRRFKKNNASVNERYEYGKINYKRCDKLETKNSFRNQNFNLTQWYCLDFSEHPVKFGGYWDGNYVDYFSMKIEATDNYPNYNFKKLDDYINQGRFISFLFPYYFFDYNDQSKPLKQIYKNYFYKLNTGLGKYDRVFFKNISSLDDKGWIIDDIFYDEVISTSQLKSDYYKIDFESSQANYLYRGVFYYERDRIKLYRSYMKIQDLGARIGGLINFIMIFCSIIIIPYNQYKRNESLFNILFEYIENTKTNNITNKETKVLNTKESYLNNKKDDILLTELKSEFSVKNKPQTLGFGFCNTLKYDYLTKCVNKNQINKMKLYNFITNYIVNRLDISFYIKFIESVKHLRILLLETKEQRTAFNYIKLPNLANKKDLNTFELETDEDPIKDATNLINYYKRRRENQNLSKIDIELINFIDNKITKHI